MPSRATVLDFCTMTLDAPRFRDAAVNGLQVEGRPSIERIATAVSVSERVIRDAVDWGADALLVHHGLLWGAPLGVIAGPTRARLALLLGHDLNLIAYHLPLDAHPTIGNNAQLAGLLGLSLAEPFAGPPGQEIGFVTQAPPGLTLDELTARVRAATEREPQVLPAGAGELTLVAVLTGSGYSALEDAAARGCQVLVTGDVRESTMALARELGIAVIAGGHEATERLGVQALADVLVREFGVETRFLPDPNPI